MFQLLAWSILISFLHGLFPNHWLPFIAIGKISNWSNQKALKVTAYLGAIHIFSTLLLGFLLFYAGNQLANNQIDIELINGIGFIVFGVVYLFIPSHQNHSQKKKNLTFGYLIISMFFSPCIEIIPFFFGLGEFGWPAFFMISLIYTFFSLIGIMFMAYFGLKLSEKLNQSFLLKNEKIIISSIFILVGIVNIAFE